MIALLVGRLLGGQVEPLIELLGDQRLLFRRLSAVALPPEAGPDRIGEDPEESLRARRSGGRIPPT